MIIGGFLRKGVREGCEIACLAADKRLYSR